MAKKKDLKKIVEEGIAAILESKDEPSDGRIKALTLGIKMCALNAKLEESEYGDFFIDAEPGIPGSVQAEPKGPKLKRGSRAPSDPEPEPEPVH